MPRKKQKLFRFEVDQSIRIEELGRDTIIGLSNKEQSFTVIITTRTKRRLKETLRKYGKPKQFGFRIFTAGILLAIWRSKFKIQDLVIDLEYPGYERIISEIINEKHPTIIVLFSAICRKSPAHYAAYGVHIGKRKPTHQASYSEIIKFT